MVVRGRRSSRGSLRRNPGNMGKIYPDVNFLNVFFLKNSCFSCTITWLLWLKIPCFNLFIVKEKNTFYKYARAICEVFFLSTVFLFENDTAIFSVSRLWRHRSIIAVASIQEGWKSSSFRVCLRVLVDLWFVKWTFARKSGNCCCYAPASVSFSLFPFRTRDT